MYLLRIKYGPIEGGFLKPIITLVNLKIVLNIGRLIKVLGSLNILPHLIVGESLGTQSEIIG